MWKKRLPRLRGEDLGGGWQRAELCLAYLKGRPLHLLQQQYWAQHVHVGRLETGPHIAAESGWGPSQLERESPTAVHWDSSLYPTARWTFDWGPAWA